MKRTYGHRPPMYRTDAPANGPAQRMIVFGTYKGIPTVCFWPPAACSVCATARSFGVLVLTPEGNRFVCMNDYEPGEGVSVPHAAPANPRGDGITPTPTPSQEGVTPLTLVPVWWDEEGHALCKECAADARIWGQQRVISTRVPAARFECEYCHEGIK